MFGKKIKYYRLKKGLTSNELAKMVGCTKASISLYESDDREPNAEICKKIADALGVTWIKLMSRDNKSLKFDHFSFRKKQKASKKDIDLLKDEIEQKCSDRFTIMNLLGIADNKPLKIKKLSMDDDCDHNALEIRKALNIPLFGPIYNLTNVLENLGVIVLSFECSEEIDGLNGIVNNIPYIFFNSNNRTIERQRFTIAHELCHLFFNHIDDSKELEKYINRLAGHLLFPDQDLYNEFGKTNRNLTIFLRDIVAIKYKIAPSCLITRLFEAGVITELYYKNFFVFLNKTQGRKNEKSLLDEKSDSEQPTVFTHQVYLALNEELITASRAAEFLNTPLYDVMQNMRVE